MNGTIIGAIEKELSQLWQPDHQARLSGHFGRQQNYTINLVVFARTETVCRHVDQVLRALTGSHPGRYVIICPAAASAGGLPQHEISAHCVYVPGRRKRICCDLIKLSAHEPLLDQLSGLTLPLLIADLPVEFWWPAELPLENSFFRKIADKADRVWIDSSAFQEPQQYLARLAGQWRQLFPHTALADLNWVRFQRWRVLIAELFDGEWVAALSRIQQLTIEYGEGSTPTRAFLLLGWLASRLGWRYAGRQVPDFPARLEFEAAAGRVTVTVKAVPVQDPKRDRLYAVIFRTGNGQAATFTVKRAADPQCVIASSEIHGQPPKSRLLYFEHLETMALLGEGLRHWGRDWVWEETLAVVGDIFTVGGV